MLDRIVYWLFRLTILVTRPLPLRLGYFVAGQVAVLCYWFVFPRHRRALKANLSQILGSDDAGLVAANARQSFRNFGKYIIDFIHFPAMSRDEVRQRLRFDQWDELNEAAADPRGKIIVTLHFGNWDLGAAALAAIDYPVHVIAETFRYAPMNELVQGSRERLGMKVFGHDRLGPAMFRLLNRGGTLAFLVDVASADGGVRADFFGGPALVSAAPARIALRTNAWVLPAIVVRGPSDDLDIRPRIDFSLRDYTPTGDEEVDVRALTGLMLASMEEMIRPYPDQWFIFRRLWQDGVTATAAPVEPAREGGQ